MEQAYYKMVLQRPLVTLTLVAILIAVFAWHIPKFRLDASSDALVLEGDQSLQYYRSIRARYGSDDFLVVTYTPNSDLFSDETLADIRLLRNRLAAMQRVESVISLLDVPLIASPPITLSELREQSPTLESPQTDRALARNEFINSPVYRNLIISPDGGTTAMQVNLKRDEQWHALLKQRNTLRELRIQSALSAEQQLELEQVSRQFDLHSAALQNQLNTDIAEVRSIMDAHRNKATLYLGGVPMIASDSVDFIRYDLTTFGVGVVLFMLAILAAAFRQPRWIILPILTCLAAGIIMVGFLGMFDWPVTVVSSNFISLLLIITLSLTVHLIVRYREIHALQPEMTQYDLLRETLASKAAPCFYTALTTIVAFVSLLLSGIRPVIDFGWMMTIGISIAFMLVFTLFPATLVLLNAGSTANQNDWTDRITGYFAHIIHRYSNATLVSSAVLAVLSVIGISMLTVENRFIDYFKDSTEIYRGMELIDTKLGGTTPLDIIIDAPASFAEPVEEEEEWYDPLLEELGLDFEDEGGITTTSYWFNVLRMKEAAEIHRYLDDLPETGKVLSMSTAMDVMQQLDNQVANDDFLLSVLYKKLPEDIKTSMLDPYMSEDGNQLRYSIRVFESDPNLKREALLDKIRQQLTGEYKLQDDQVHLTGMLVLYNNMLQSLFKSQILTIGVVFLAILFMFMVSFRNLRMAAIAIVPNMFAVALMLGLMGWLHIPLDMMTITIAAISIGIAVDDTIHYVHRITEEYRLDNNYWAAVKRSHASIGRAMYYTTITITLGFSILVLSNFIPTIYFGLLTGFAMVTALFANLTLLPLLIVKFKPLTAQS